jgi:hypothetical protein
LSGCYDPGTFWLFPATEGDGLGDDGATIAFEKGRELTGSDGRKLLRKPDQTQNFESFGSWLDAVDWDDDGDLDLVCGGFGGELFVFVNEGTRTTPSYLSTPALIQLSDGSTAHVPGNHGAVVAADWDGDGLFDLVCGSASGAVVWFRNVGKRGKPLLAPPETLVPATPNSGYMVWLEPGAAPQPGIRAQIDVVDWNGDGKPDLLVGDFCTTVTPRADLTDEQKRAVASLRLQRDSADAEVAKLRKNVDEGLSTFMKSFKPEEIVTPEVQTKIREKQAELEKEPRYAAAAKRAGDLWDELAKFLQKVPGKPGFDDWQQPHGWVWVYVRK